MTADPHAVPFNLLSDDFHRDPPAMFAALRERCPVHHTTVPAEHYTLALGAGVLVSSDLPRHTTERLAISLAFKSSVLEAMEPDIRTLVDELMGAVVPEGRGHLVRDVAMSRCAPAGRDVLDARHSRRGHLDVPIMGAVDGGRGGSRGRSRRQRTRPRGLSRVLRLLRPPRSTTSRRHRGG